MLDSPFIEESYRLHAMSKRSRAAGETASTMIKVAYLILDFHSNQFSNCFVIELLTKIHSIIPIYNISKISENEDKQKQISHCNIKVQNPLRQSYSHFTNQINNNPYYKSIRIIITKSVNRFTSEMRHNGNAWINMNHERFTALEFDRYLPRVGIFKLR